MLAKLCSMRVNAPCVSSTSRWPASVSTTERVVRRTSGTPAARSSSAMRMLADALETPSRRAAWV